MYKEFAKQYDDRILDHFGTGSMHFCGRADQWIFEMAATPNLLSLNFGWMEKLLFVQEYLDFIMPELSKKDVYKRQPLNLALLRNNAGTVV